MHLTLLEHGVYRLMLDKYYTFEGPLPSDTKTVQRLLGARSNCEQEAVTILLDEFFTLETDGWHHSRCDAEIEAFRAKIQAASTNGKRGGRPRKKPEESEIKAKKTEPFNSAFENKSSPDSRLQTPIKIDAADRQRSRLDELEASLRLAAGAALDPTSLTLSILDRPLAWLEAGFSLELDIIPTIRTVSARASPNEIRGWKYFDQAIADTHKRRTAPVPEGRNDERNHRKSPDATARENHLAGLTAALASPRR